MNIFLTRDIPETGLEILRRAGEVTVAATQGDVLPGRREILEGVRTAGVLVSHLTEQIGREVMEAGSRLLGISNYAVGCDNIDVEAATELGLPVGNTPGVLTDSTADFTWALLMAVARKLVGADSHVRGGHYDVWTPGLFAGDDISPGGDGRQKVLGIIGFGRIGQAVWRRGLGFGMRVLAHDPRSAEWIRETEDVEYAELDRLLRESDFVTLHTDLNPSTHHLIDRDALAKMKPTAYLINTSRGAVVDEAALVEALRQHKISGAALDVFESEPALTPGLAELDNVVLTPHIASGSRATREKMAVLCAENAVAHLRRQRAPHCVNPEVYETEAYRKRAG